MNDHKKKYHAYLRSERWRYLTYQVWQRCRGVCERCHSAKMTQTHHLTYDRVFEEDLSDLLGVCRRCHLAEHGVSLDDELERLLREL